MQRNEYFWRIKYILMRRFTTLLATALASILGCSSTACQTPFRSLDAAEFAQLLESPGVQLVDVRTPEEFAAGHIPGAVNIDVYADDFLAQCLDTLDKDRELAVYCRSGRRSKEAAGKLSKAGFKVSELDGGFISWTGPREKAE